MWEGILIVAVVLFILSIVYYWEYRNKSAIPYSVWALMVFAILLVIVALVARSYESVWYV